MRPPAHKVPLTGQKAEILRRWFLDHLDFPYPNPEEKSALIQQTGLDNSERVHFQSLTKTEV